MKKIFLSFKPPDGSYGGGAFFVKNIVKYLQEKGYNITFQLQPNIDILFIIDPRKSINNRYSIDEIIKYKARFPNVKIIHRVNECDIKREKSINIEPLLVKTMKNADKVIFISKWLQNYFVTKYKLKLDSCYILNGCSKNNFFLEKNMKFKNNKIKIVTHHWSNNYLKGFHIYNAIDKLLESRKDIEFTYIGNYNPNYKPKNIKILAPTCGRQLGHLISQHDIYITATQNEPCGMHHIEGLSCGLPILYCAGGGAIEEVCSGVGEEYYNIETLLDKIDMVKENYNNYVNNIDYNYISSDRCCEEYMEVIKSFNIID